MHKPVFLIGFMGSGKTTLGKKIAQKLSWDFVDLDHLIESESGMPIPEYFRTQGEEKFRVLERNILLKSLEMEKTIVGAGGGTPCFFDNIEKMNEKGITIYLKLPAKALYHRLMQTNISERPALQGLSGDDLLHFIEKKLEERSSFYEKALHHVSPLKNPIKGIIQILENQA